MKRTTNGKSRFNFSAKLIITAIMTIEKVLSANVAAETMMNANNKNIFRKFITLFGVVLVAGLFCIPPVNGQLTFPGTGFGPIPDGTAAGIGNYGAPRDISFDLTGVPGNVAFIEVDFNAGHTWVGDLKVTLIAPNNTEHLLFARTGATTATGSGSSKDLLNTNTYTFGDSYFLDWWYFNEIGTGTMITSALSRTVVAGGAGVTYPPAVTSMNTSFAGLATNGIWKLRFEDGQLGDAGSVTAANLTITTVSTGMVTKTPDTNDGLCDADCSLREAIVTAQEGDTINFSTLFNTPQTITLGGTRLSINKSLTINGPGADKLTVSGNNVSSVIFVVQEKTVNLSGIKVTNGEAGNGNAGGITNNGITTITNCIISDSIGGGGVINKPGLSGAPDSNPTLINSTIFGNTSQYASSGGGIYNGGTLTVINSTISGNHATHPTTSISGGIYIGAGTATIINSTITNNSANGPDDAGGILRYAFGTVTIRNTIVAGNVDNAAIPDVKGSLISAGYNLIGNVGTVTSFDQIGDLTGNSTLPINPRLAPLANNGGTTPTHVPLRFSRALDKGKRSGSTTDQRGLARPFDQPGIINGPDGDGKADLAIWRSNGSSGAEFWLNRSTAGTFIVGFGTSTDKPVPGDYTGDGKTDVAFWRPTTGEWFILRSEDSSFYSFPFGANGDIPAPGNYDGDGTFDATVFRPGIATWFINGSTSGTTIQAFGATTDRPLANAYVP